MSVTRLKDDNIISITAPKITGTPTFDDNKILNDISTLALRQASNENKVAYDTASTYVDVFQDSSGITGLTNATRSTDEYINSLVAGTVEADWPYTSASDQVITNDPVNRAALIVPNTHHKMSQLGGNAFYMSAGMYVTNPSGDGAAISNGNYYVTVDYKAQYEWKGFKVVWYNNGGMIKTFKVLHSNDGTNFSVINLTGSSNQAITTSPRAPSVPNFANNITGTYDATGLLTNNGGSAGTNTAPGVDTAHGGHITLGTPVTARYLRIAAFSSLVQQNNNPAFHGFIPRYIPDVINATGSFESNAITSSASTTSMGAVITYQDQAGTNALNSDIVLKLSANGGSSYATATLTALPDFATGIKMAKVNDLSVTAGTSLKYKIELANQSGSKEARIRGVSLQY